MARRRRQGHEVGRTTALRPFDPIRDLFVPRLVPPIAPRPRGLVLIEDRRLFHPSRAMRPAQSFSRRDQRRVLENPFHPGKFGFAVPDKVAICVRRKVRREVIHAKRKAGGGVSRRRRRTRFSNVHC